MRPVQQRARAGAVADNDISDLVLTQRVLEPHQTHVAVGTRQASRDHTWKLVYADGERDQHRRQQVECALRHADMQRSVGSEGGVGHREAPA